MVTQAAAAATEKLQLELIAPVDGLMYIYIANETNDDINVYFDNLTITYTGLQVVEQTDYYPYGMVMRKETPSQGQGLYSRYRYGYQGQYAEKDEETGWNHFKLRQYGSRIGRWTATDPYRAGFSSYWAMNNNPIKYTDPDGGCPTCPGGDDVYAIGAIVENNLGSWTYLGGQNWENNLTGFIGNYNNYPSLIEPGLITGGDFFDKWSTSDNFLSSMSYSIVDGVYVTAQFFTPWWGSTHLNGGDVSGQDGADAFVSTATNAISFVKLSNISKLSAPQFSALFKGTFVARLAPKTRGFLNNFLNRQTAKVHNTVLTGTTAIEVVDNINKSE